MRKNLMSAIVFFLAVVLVVNIPVTQCFAIENDIQSEIEYLEDGGYIITTTEELGTRATKTKIGSRTQSKYDSNNTLEWQIVLRGEFTYTGSTASCTAVTIAVNIYNTTYSKVSSSSSRSGNTAYGTAVIAKKALGITISTDTYNLSLSCDANGNFT